MCPGYFWLWDKQDRHLYKHIYNLILSRVLVCNVLACLPTTWTSCERKRSKYLQCLEQHEGLISNDGQPTPSVYLIFFSNELKKNYAFNSCVYSCVENTSCKTLASRCVVDCKTGAELDTFTEFSTTSSPRVFVPDDYDDQTH